MQNGWNIASCAKCYAPVAHDAPRCVRCQINYCSFTLADQSSSLQPKRPRPSPSIKEMKAAIRQAGLGVADLLERSDVEARYAQAQARLAAHKSTV